MFDVKKVREDFPILSRSVHDRPLVYLDSGATAQKPFCVIESVNTLHRSLNANIHRGAHYLSGECTTLYEQARKRVASFINAAHEKEIVFTSGATASLNLVASSYGDMVLKEGDEVIVSEMEHHSNIVPWQLICLKKGASLLVLPFNNEGLIEMDKLDTILSPRTKIVAITQSSNTLGTNPDIKTIIRKAHNVGAKVVIDGCQGIIHSKSDMQDLDCDFYAFSGHKLYAPTGIGVLYAKEYLLEEMPPYMGGGDMVKSVSFEKTVYADIPLKFEAGTSNYIGAIALGEAIEYINQFDFSQIKAHEKKLLDYATTKLQDIEGLKIYGNAKDKCAIISFNIESVHHYDLGMIVDKMGVAIRTGTHCAEPTMTHYGVTGMARASFAMYNTIEEIDILTRSVEIAGNMLR